MVSKLRRFAVVVALAFAASACSEGSAPSIVPSPTPLPGEPVPSPNPVSVYEPLPAARDLVDDSGNPTGVKITFVSVSPARGSKVKFRGDWLEFRYCLEAEVSEDAETYSAEIFFSNDGVSPHPSAPGKGSFSMGTASSAIPGGPPIMKQSQGCDSPNDIVSANGVTPKFLIVVTKRLSKLTGGKNGAKINIAVPTTSFELDYK